MKEKLGDDRDIHAEFLKAKFRYEGNPDATKEYFMLRVEEIKAGKSTWMARNFESEGLCFDYYVDGSSVAILLFGGVDGGGFETYVGNESSKHSTIEDAVQSVEERFQN